MTSDDAHRNEEPGQGLAATSASSIPAADPDAASAAAGAGDSQSIAGQVIDGRYRIVAKLGEGGMGEVYAAEHVHIEKRVAVKLLRHEILTNQEAVTRFRQEARSASSIGHQNIIAIEDFGTLPDGRIYLCMELLEGDPLNDLLEQPMAPERILNIMIQTCHGLAAAHRKGIVHRDMKPENIFVTRMSDGSEVPKLLDFGIAKVSGADGDNNLTRTGTIFGTPFYMSPEQALGQGVDHRADIYAMGIILYEALTGSIPFQGESFMGILTKHITAEPTPPSQRAVENGRFLPPGMEEIIARCMQKNPEDRYATMDELIGDLVALHRNLAGPGMSAYMEAHVPPPSAAFSAVGGGGMHAPTPMPRAHSAGGMSAPGAHPSTGSDPGFSRPGDAAAAGMPRRGSKRGLIAAIVVVLAVAGGGAAFLLLSKDKQGGAGVDTGEQAGITTGDGGAGGALAVNTGVDPAPAGQDGTGEPDGGPDEGQVQAGQGTGTEQGAGAAKPVPAMPKIVLLASKPDAAVFQDGVALGKTPLNIRVLPGATVTVTLRRRGYHDAEIAMDGSKAKEVVALHRKRRSGGGKNGDKGDKGGGDKDDGDPKDKDPKDRTGDLNLGLE